MDVAHLIVGGLTVAFLTLLVLVEIRSRRNTAAQEKKGAPGQRPSNVSPERQQTCEAPQVSEPGTAAGKAKVA